jgi:hypothetical protein
MHPNTHWMFNTAPWSQLWPLAVTGLLLIVVGFIWNRPPKEKQVDRRGLGL